MKPISFHEQEVIYNAPPGQEDEIMPLPVLQVIYVGEGQRQKSLISCWKPSWNERLKILFGRTIHLAVMGEDQPPVLLSVDKLW